MSSNTRISALERKLAEQQRFEEINAKIFSTLDIGEVLIHIMQETLSLVECDRCTVFAVDNDAKEIFSKVKQGEDLTEIRVPISMTSIAGYVATTGNTVDVVDVYDGVVLQGIHPDLRFDQSWDQKSGYRTKSVLAAAIKYKENIVGVIQCINKIGTKFSEHDHYLVEKLAHFAALALNNVRSHQKMTRQFKRRSIGDILLEKEILSEDILNEAEDEARSTNSRLETVLMKTFNISDRDIAQCEAELYNMPYLEFQENMEIGVSVADSIPEETARRYKFMPLKIVEKDGQATLNLVLRNPRDLVLLDNIKIKTGFNIGDLSIGVWEEIEKMIGWTYGGGEEYKESDKLDVVLDEIEDMTEDVDMVEVKEGANETETPITKLVDKIIEEAYKADTSDIHIEGFKTFVRVRYRKDGSLFESFRFPKHAQKACTSRIKILSKLDISERRKPQSGRIKFKVGRKKEIELRVECLPTISEEEDESNEDIVMRILAGGSQVHLDHVGFSPKNMNDFKSLVKQPYGMILVVGPTGSGKTTTLYSGINFINTVDTKILTAEDPVEIRLEGVRQVAVQPKIGYTFAAALRSFLRCDPNVVLIGEMRDLETAEIAVKAALTGHLVFSTLHTNNAPATVTRLIDMGINPFNLADALLTVLAQRLCKRLCGCKEAYIPSPKELAYMGLRFENGVLKCSQFEWNQEKLKEINALDSQGNLILYRPKGCAKCNNSGMKGRVAVHEMMVMNDELKGILYRGGTVDQIRDVGIKGGMVSLYYDGIQKVVQGMTHVEEILGECGGADEIDLEEAKKFVESNPELAEKLPEKTEEGQAGEFDSWLDETEEATEKTE